MKIGVISDIHGYPPNLKDQMDLMSCDAVCVCGDIFDGTNLKAFANKEILAWFKNLANAGKKVLATPGNHDIVLYRSWLEKIDRPLDMYCRDIWKAEVVDLEALQSEYGFKLLIDEVAELDDGRVKVFGTAWSPSFCNWAFMKDDPLLEENFSKMPENVDIVLSHSPPLTPNSEVDVSDYDRTEHLGSASLARVVKQKNPKWLFCGHIHSGDHNEALLGQTKVVNVSYVNERYVPYYKPFIFEI